MEVRLPYPPSVNSCWQGNGRRRYVSKEVVLFRARVLNAPKPAKPMAGRLSVGLLLYPPDDGRTRDIDNANKTLFDAMAKAGWFANDAQIKELHAFMQDPEGDGFALVRVEPFGGLEDG